MLNSVFIRCSISGFSVYMSVTFSNPGPLGFGLLPESILVVDIFVTTPNISSLLSSVHLTISPIGGHP
tara:strand:- start:455 stop:658 length:204 start_codon:yes stop_codon:yes gene_type:complete